MTTYRSNARFISKNDNVECYEYRGIQYNIELDNQVPVELQHKYEQDFIDYYKYKEYEAQIQDYLEEEYEEDLC